MKQPEIFTTERIAEILSASKWRVGRFAEIKKFGITPAFGEAKGSGSRRLYNLENVCEMALASWLLEAGLRIEVIGRALNRMRRQGGLSYLLELPDAKAQDSYLGVIRAPRGKITGQEAVFLQSWEQLVRIFARDSDASVLIIPVGLRFLTLKHRLEEQRKGKTEA
jgi:DNA-binding transcriptional MerR regulator